MTNKKYHRPIERLKVLQQKPSMENEENLEREKQLRHSLEIVNRLMATSDQSHVVHSIREILRSRAQK